MPDVISLGSFGQQRPSILDGLPDAIASGLKVGAEINKNKILLAINRNKNITAEDIANDKDLTSLTIADSKNKTASAIAGMKDATSLKRIADKKAYESAKLEKESKDIDFKHAQKLLEDHTMATAYMDPAAKAKYDASGHGDQINKVIAKGLGIYPNEVPELSPIDVIKNSLNKTKADYIAAVRSGQPVPKPLQDAYTAIQQHGVDDIAIAAHMTSSNQDIDHKDPKAVSADIANNLNDIKAARAGKSPGSNQQTGDQSTPLSNAIAGDQNSNDPLGILKYLKPGN